MVQWQARQIAQSQLKLVIARAVIRTCLAPFAASPQRRAIYLRILRDFRLLSAWFSEFGAQQWNLTAHPLPHTETVDWSCAVSVLMPSKRPIDRSRMFFVKW